MSIDLYTPIKSVLDQLGYPVQIYTVSDAASKPCPCTEGPWGQYSEVWHMEHPEAPNCHRTGMLAADGTEGFFEVETIRGIGIPHFSYVGKSVLQMEMGLDWKWEWMGITQSTSFFNRWIQPNGQIFIVQNDMPFYVGGDGTQLVVALYGLTPINNRARIP